MPDKTPDSTELAYATEHYNSVARQIARHQIAYETYKRAVPEIDPGRVAGLTLQEYVQAAAQIDGAMQIAGAITQASLRKTG